MATVKTRMGRNPFGTLASAPQGTEPRQTSPSPERIGAIVWSIARNAAFLAAVELAKGALALAPRVLSGATWVRQLSKA
jgi:hypothetical protein